MNDSEIIEKCTRVSHKVPGDFVEIGVWTLAWMQKSG